MIIRDFTGNINIPPEYSAPLQKSAKKTDCILKTSFSVIQEEPCPLIQGEGLLEAVLLLMIIY